MEGHNYLGIYIGKDTATAVCIGSQGRQPRLQGCFSASVGEEEGQKQHTLASLIAQGCAERELKFSEVAVALDCAMFMQHSVHSEFTDPKRIAQTIRFDAEEALATDISDVAISFKAVSSGEGGSDLAVFTSQRKELSDVLLALQSNNIDPVTVEPDVNCLSRFISQNLSWAEGSRPFFCVLSRRAGYFVVPTRGRPRGDDAPATRTFLVGPRQNRSELLAREVSMTTALVQMGGSIDSLNVFDSNGAVEHGSLGKRLGVEVKGIDLLGAVAIDPEMLADCADPVDFVIAYGAALANSEKTQIINFRDDFMPYQGKKARLEKALKLAAVFVSLLVLALGVYVTRQLWQQNRYRSRLHNKLKPDYLAVLPGKTDLPSKLKEAAGILGRELTRVRRVSSPTGPGAEEGSILAKLTLVLEAFNNCASQTKLQVEKIVITARTIRVEGDTSSRANTLKLFDSIRRELEIQTFSYEAAGVRDSFSVTLALKKST